MRYSYTALSTYNTCPLQFKVRFHDRWWPRGTTSPALIKGRKVHDDMEKAIRTGKEPDNWAPEGLVAVLHKLFKQDLCKPEAALKSGKLTGKIDVLAADSKQALMIDWKTGKYRPDELQADIYATLLRKAINHTTLDVAFSFVYLDEQRAHTVYPDAGAEQRVMSVVDVIERDTELAPRPNYSCRWCPIKSCQYNLA